MDLIRLATLKDKLASATNFSDVMVYFFDHFGEDPDFMGLGETGHVPFLETVLAEVAKQLYKDSGLNALVIDFRLVRLPGAELRPRGRHDGRQAGERHLFRGRAHGPADRHLVGRAAGNEVRPFQRPPDAAQPDAVAELSDNSVRPFKDAAL